MSNNTYSIPAAYIRIASTSIATYDYFRTVPTVFEFYRSEWRTRQFSDSLCLLFLIRVTSIALLVISDVGFFYTHFSYESCSKFYLIAPMFKALQVMIAQCIMGVRTYNISGRSRGVGAFLLVFYLTACGLQWYSNIYGRLPSFDPATGDCLGKLISGHHIGSWFYYVVAIVYDITTTSISVFYLLKYKRTISNNSIIARFIDSMFYDGMGYFVILTVPNALNLGLYQSKNSIQASAVTIGYVMTWLMSQNLILSQYKARIHHRLAGSVIAPSKAPRPVFPPSHEQHTGSTMQVSTPPALTSFHDGPTDTDLYGTRSGAMCDDEAGVGFERERDVCDDDVEEDIPNPGLQIRFERSVHVERIGRTRESTGHPEEKNPWGR
ncbi:hypothetical protein BDN67DRAFT_968846 [Paxillus ammoniavirescens]|nr:hypothetical protein BDN67DRAFT_968846 [Paxillus ammoniavirescens]